MSEQLKSINRLATHAKLESVRKIDDCWIAIDVISALSESKVRDMRLINDWDESTVVIKKKIRKYRCFTLAGIEKYLSLGKCYSYKNACEYFGITPVDKKLINLKDELSKCLEPDGTTYNTKKILQFICEKRKQVKSLGLTITIAEFIVWCEKHPDGVSGVKLEFIKTQ